MISNAYDRLKLNPDLQTWWQGVLNDPKFPLIIEAAKVLVEQRTPAYPAGVSPLEVFALAQASAVGSRSAFEVLDDLGSRAIGGARVAEANFKATQAKVSPQHAGTGYGERAIASEKPDA